MAAYSSMKIPATVAGETSGERRRRRHPPQPFSTEVIPQELNAGRERLSQYILEEY